MAKIEFEPNKPVEVALKYRDGREVDGRYGQQMFYSLTDGRSMYLDLEVAEKIRALGVERGELFLVEKRWDGKKGHRATWHVWRPAADEIEETDETGIPDSELMREVKQSIHVARQATGTWPERKAHAATLDGTAPPSQPNDTRSQGAEKGRDLLAPRMTGTTASNVPPDANHGHGSTNGNGGNGSGRLLAPAAGGQPPMKIPLDQAAVLAVQMMQRALKDTGEQWSDAARQDFTSTLIIGMRQEGWLCLPSLPGGVR